MRTALAYTLGNGRKHVAALVVPSREHVAQWAADKDMDATDIDTLLASPELLARIRVALRHAQRGPGTDQPVVVAGAIKVDLGARRVSRGDEEIRFQISADHTPFDIDSVLEVLSRFAG